MATEIRVPTLGESVTEATIGRWFKKAGEAVADDHHPRPRAVDLEEDECAENDARKLRAGRGSSYRKVFKPHLQNRIEITEKHERHIRPQTNPPDEIDNAR